MVTGAALAFPETARAVLAGTLGTAPDPAEGAGNATDLGLLDVVAANAQAKHPLMSLRSVLPPREGERNWVVALAEDGRATLAVTRVELDPRTGVVVVDLPPCAGDRVLAWVRPLHNGAAFGLPYRIALSVLGAVPTLLLVTGFLVRRDKRRSRERVERLARSARQQDRMVAG